MYRALALKAIENDFAFDEESRLLDWLTTPASHLEPQLEGNRVLLDGVDVSRRIREADVTGGRLQCLGPSRASAPGWSSSSALSAQRAAW